MSRSDGIPNSRFPTARVYDTLGRRVAALVSDRQAADRYRAFFHGSSFSSGIYFYRLQAVSFTGTRRMAVVK